RSMAREPRLTSSDRAPHPPAPPGHRSRGILWGRILGTLALVVVAIALVFGALALMDDGDGATPATDATTQHLPLPQDLAAGPGGGLVALLDEGEAAYPLAAHAEGEGCAGVPLALAP